MPSYLRSNFTLHKLRYAGATCLLAEPTNEVMIPTPQLAKQLQILSTTFGLMTALVIDHITPALRNSLTTRGINFIVTGKQLFLPELMIHLGETYKVQA